MPRFFYLALVLLASAGTAHAENLYLKFGPSWSCKMISLDLDKLYQKCLDCDKEGKDINRTGENKGECVTRYPRNSLRGVMEDKVRDTPPDIVKERERQQQINDAANAREAAIQEKMRRDARRPTRESDVSGSASGSSRAPTDKNPDKMTKLMGEMQGMESRQKELKSTLDDKEIARREEAFRREEQRETDRETQAYHDAQRRAQKAQSEFGPNIAVFRITNSYKYAVHLKFFSQNRSHEWPGNQQVWPLRDSKSHTFRLACKAGEKICFGAWSSPRGNPYWGRGTDNSKGCQACCIACGDSSAFVTNLVYDGPEETAGGDSGGGGGSSSSTAADLLGAAVGIAGFAAGLAAGSGGGGGGPSYRSAPTYRPSGNPRNRESGVSGGR
jgi:hypothetical protein